MAIAAALVGTRGSSTGTTLATGGGSTTTGSTFVIVVNYDASATLSTALSALDNKGNTYTEAGTTQSLSGAKRALYYCQNGSGGASHAASATFSSAANGTIYLIEITGAATASFDVTATGSSGTSPHTLATGTLGQAAEVIITVCGNGEGNNPMTYASSNTTIIDQEGNGATYWSSCVSKLVVASTTTVSPSFTSNGGTNTHGLKLATFKESAGATAAVLSSATPSGTLGTTTTATLGATTDQTTGTFYGVVDSAGNISGVTATQIKAGQKASGTSALASASAAVSTSAPGCAVSGLSAATAYSYAIVQNNANGDSNVLTGTFTTASAAASPETRKYGPQGALKTLLTM